MLTQKYEVFSGNEKFRIVFILSFDMEWDCFSTIYRAFVSSKDSEVLVLSDDCPRKNSQVSSEFLFRNNIDFVKVEDYSVGNNKPHIIIIADEITLRRNSWILRSKARIVYIPYGTSVSAAKYSQRQQYNLQVHNHSWRIFVAGDFIKKLYEEYCDVGSKHVVVLGHPKIEAIWLALNKNKFPRQSYSSSNPCKILWNIHFDNNGDWSTWKKYGVPILNIFASRDDVTLICRPHPFFFDSLNDKTEDVHIKELFRRNKNTIFDDQSSMKNSFVLCDALLTDGSSIIYDYFITGKPILYLRHRNSAKMHSHCFKLIKSYHYIGNSIVKIENFIDMVVAGADDLKDIRNKTFSMNAEMPKPIRTGFKIQKYIERELKN
jgi:hypothetical protein